LAFYQATTYYDKNSEEAIVDSVAESISKLGYLKVKKNGILLLGSAKRAGIQECASYLGIR
jgi:hypothetical protein